MPLIPRSGGGTCDFCPFSDETNSVIQVVKGQTTVTLAGLLANTRYVIQVAASNRKGRGPLSPKKTCVTTEAPPEAPGRKLLLILHNK